MNTYETYHPERNVPTVEAQKVPDYSIRIPDETDIALAEVVAQWTQGAKTMLPKTTEEMLQLFTQGHSVLIEDEEGKPLCHAAATFVYPDGTVEVGGIYTDPAERGKGLATHATLAAIAMIQERYPEQTIFALANIMSAPMFVKMGGRKMAPSELDAAIWEPCDTCPKNPTKNQENVIFQCCDVPYELTQVGKK